MFGSGTQETRGLPLPKGTMAVAVELGDPQRVAGFVQPGSEVAVFATTAAEGGTPSTAGLLLERVPVVAVGQSTLGGAGAPSADSTNARAPTAIHTLALTQEQAQKVVLSTSAAPMYLALLDRDSKVDDNAPATGLDSLLD
jgi:pilus assembly protein CpaB